MSRRRSYTPPRPLPLTREQANRIAQALLKQDDSSVFIKVHSNGPAHSYVVHEGNVTHSDDRALALIKG